jgi:tetratricopeptide (TPR) repeat protein
VERAVLQTFVTARLLVTKHEKGASAETIEVAHEALIRRWEKLREALGHDREFLLWRRRLDFRRREWEANQRHESLLLRGVPLEEARFWLNERGVELISTEREFITWEDRPEFQVERVLTKSPDLLLLSGGRTRESYFTTLVFCGDKEKALLIARSIENDHDRAYALKLIAEAMAKAGIMPDAISVAHEIKDANVRVSALGALVQALARIGLTVEAQLAGSEAQVAIQEIESADGRVSVLSQIIEALARVGMLTEMRQAVEEAIATANEIRSAHARTTKIESIVAVLAKVGMVSEAIALANKIDTEAAYARARALNSIAEAQAKEGMLAEAFHTLKEALVAAHNIESTPHREFVLSPIAETLAKAGRTSEALAAVREIEDEVYRIRPLAMTAEALVKAEPRADWQSILRMIEDVVDARRRSAGLAHWIVAQALAEAGRVADLLAVTHEIGEASSRGNLLGQASEALAKAGKIIESLAITRHIEHASTRAKPLGVIVEASMKIGITTETAFTATEALMVAREIEEAFVHANALMAVADSWLAKGQIGEARNLVSDVQDAISKIFNDQERSKALGRLASILARLRLYRAARETAEQCSGSSDRLAAYTAILREYHIVRDPDLAQLFAGEEEGVD